jgi:hypothetical protein
MSIVRTPGQDNQQVKTQTEKDGCLDKANSVKIRGKAGDRRPEARVFDAHVFRAT